MSSCPDTDIDHLRIKKWGKKRENTALIQIIKRKPFYQAFLFCFQERVRALEF